MMDSQRSPRTGDVLVPDSKVLGQVTIGSGAPLRARPKQHARQLNRSALRRLLRSAPKLTHDALLDVIFDESWSVRGGNDTIGLRHEVILVTLEHLAAGLQAKGKWYVRISTFDHPSVFDLPITRLDRRGLAVVEDVLLRASPAGCSILGPSLNRAEQSATEFSGRYRLLVVLSDFELFDQSPMATLQELTRSSATCVLAVSLSNEPPAMLSNSHVLTARVLPSDAPTDLANHVLDAARACSTLPNKAVS